MKTLELNSIDQRLLKLADLIAGADVELRDTWSEQRPGYQCLKDEQEAWEVLQTLGPELSCALRTIAMRLKPTMHPTEPETVASLREFWAALPEANRFESTFEYELQEVESTGRLIAKLEAQLAEVRAHRAEAMRQLSKRVDAVAHRDWQEAEIEAAKGVVK